MKNQKNFTPNDCAVLEFYVPVERSHENFLIAVCMYVTVTM